MSKSPSTRRAWIEIFCASLMTFAPAVALHPEGVDRNRQYVGVKVQFVVVVALHPEGVDRNGSMPYGVRQLFAVALHPEGVDRNGPYLVVDNQRPVALHPEGVDRNPKD